MNQISVLEQVERNELTAQDALNKLYPVKKSKPGKRAFFVKMNVRVPEEGKGINTFLKILFAIPIPLIFARIGLRIAKRFMKTDEFDMNEIIKMIKYSKNTTIQVDSEDAKIDIKII